MVRKKKQVVYPIIFMIIVTSVFTLVLAIINDLTYDTIQEQSRIKTYSKLLYALDIEYENNDESIVSTYNAYITEESTSNYTYYIAEENGEILGYAFEVIGNGLWGQIRSYVAFNESFQELKGVDFISHSETPGLGGRIDERWFVDQFQGIELTQSEDGEFLIFKPSIGGNIDSITGATQTSKSVRTMFNENIEEILQVKEEVINESAN
ncbi:MAG: FMN-binding protein [Bacillota bacterium]|nr:FMN-binding protein [Bacillota bacterium]